MSPELEAAATEATTDAKAAAWAAFLDAVFAWGLSRKDPAAMRALADAACEYAGKRVERHVAEAVAAETQACITAIEDEWEQDEYAWPIGVLEDRIAIHARSQAPAPSYQLHYRVDGTAKAEPDDEVTETPREASPFEGHTPGPWCVDGYGQIKGPKGHKYALATTDGRLAEHEVWANTYLIAAAPALLAERDALKAEVEQLKGGDDEAARLLHCDIKRLGERNAGLRAALEDARDAFRGEGDHADAVKSVNEALAKWGGES